MRLSNNLRFKLMHHCIQSIEVTITNCYKHEFPYILMYIPIVNNLDMEII